MAIALGPKGYVWPILPLQLHHGQRSEPQILSAFNSSNAHFLQPQGLCTGGFSHLACFLPHSHFVIPYSHFKSHPKSPNLSTAFFSDTGLGTFLYSVCCHALSSPSGTYSRFYGTLGLLPISPSVCEPMRATPVSLLLCSVSLALSRVSHSESDQYMNKGPIQKMKLKGSFKE